MLVGIEHRSGHHEPQNGGGFCECRHRMSEEYSSQFHLRHELLLFWRDAIPHCPKCSCDLAERNDLASSEGCMGLNAISEFGLRDSEVSRITHNAAQVQRHALMETLARAKNQGEFNPDANLDIMVDFFESTLAGIRMAAKSGQKAAGTSEYCGLCGKSVHGVRSLNRSRMTGNSHLRVAA